MQMHDTPSRARPPRRRVDLLPQDWLPPEQQLAVRQLAQNMTEHGQRYPIVIGIDGYVIAGRKRLAAARMLGWPDIMTVVADPDLKTPNSTRVSPRDVPVIRTYIERLTSVVRGQFRREMMVAARHNRLVRKGVITDPLMPIPAVPQYNRMASIVSRIAGYSEKETYNIITAIEANYPDIQQWLDEHPTDAGSAYNEARARRKGRAPRVPGARVPRRPQHSPDAPFVIKSTRDKVYAESQKKRMERGLSTISGVCIGLDNMNVAMALSVCSDEEIDTWTAQVRNSLKILRSFVEKVHKNRNGQSPQSAT